MLKTGAPLHPALTQLSPTFQPPPFTLPTEGENWSQQASSLGPHFGISLPLNSSVVSSEPREVVAASRFALAGLFASPGLGL